MVDIVNFVISNNIIVYSIPFIIAFINRIYFGKLEYMNTKYTTQFPRSVLLYSTIGIVLATINVFNLFDDEVINSTESDDLTEILLYLLEMEVAVGIQIAIFTLTIHVAMFVVALKLRYMSQ